MQDPVVTKKVFDTFVSDQTSSMTSPSGLGCRLLVTPTFVFGIGRDVQGRDKFCPLTIFEVREFHLARNYMLGTVFGRAFCEHVRNRSANSWASCWGSLFVVSFTNAVLRSIVDGSHKRIK